MNALVASGHSRPMVAVLRIWLACGVALVVLVPPLRGVDPLFGWLPFWLIVAPLIDLTWLHRNRIVAAVCSAVAAALLVTRARRHPARQARRLRRVYRHPLVLRAAGNASAVETRDRSTTAFCAAARGERIFQSLMPRRFLSMRRRNSSMIRRYRSSPR